MTDEERTIDNIEITAEELAENADKCVIFDMRSEHDRAYGLIPCLLYTSPSPRDTT